MRLPFGRFVSVFLIGANVLIAQPPARLTCAKHAIALLPTAGDSKPAQIASPGGQFNTLAFSADGKWIAVAFSDFDKRTRTLGVWDVETMRPVFISHQKEEWWGFEALAFSPDKKRLIAVNHESERNVITIWDTASGKRLKKLVWPRDWRSIHNAVPVRAILWNKDGQPVLHDAHVGTVTDLATSTIIRDYRKHTRRETMHPDLVVCFDDQDRHVVLDALTGETISKHPYPASGFYLGHLSFSKDGKTRAIADEKGPFVTRGMAAEKTRIPFDWDKKRLEYTILSRDGRWLALAYAYREEVKAARDGMFVEVFDTKSARQVGVAMEGAYVWFSPDNSKLAIAARGGPIVIVNIDVR